MVAMAALVSGMSGMLLMAAVAGWPTITAMPSVAARGVRLRLMMPVLLPPSVLPVAVSRIMLHDFPS
jgi:hypothetical protein